MFVLYSNPASAQPPSVSANASSTEPAATAPKLPDAPEVTRARERGSSAVTPETAVPYEGQQTKRILGIIPNFRSVSANTHLPPQSPKEKFIDVVHDSFDYSSFAFIGLLSGVSQLQGSVPEFHTGVPAYGRYYWHNFVDQTDENFLVGFLLPVALHQDARYYTMGRESVGRESMGSGGTSRHNGIAKRAGYAFSRILVTRTDSGGRTFNSSEVVGAGASAGISNLYYPSSNVGWTKTGQRWALNVGLDATTFVFKEFWPDLNHAIFRKQ